MKKQGKKSKKLTGRRGKNSSLDAREQSRLFKETARELGAADMAREDDVMKRLAGQKRHEDAPKKKPSR